MRLLFISQDARIIRDDKGNCYLNSHMNRNTIKRVANICSEMHMILRDSGNRCSENEAQKKYNIFPDDLVKLYIGFNPYSPKRNIIDIRKIREFNRLLSEQIRWADKVIMSSAIGFYTNMAIPICKKYKKPYMPLVIGFAFEMDWHHSIYGKMVALIREYRCRRNMKYAPYALYVTSVELQKRYPCKGKTLGCSDVEIAEMDNNILEARLQNIKAMMGDYHITIGTAAALDVKWKGQRYVIKAIAKLKKLGINNYTYELLGSGNPAELKRIIRENHVEENVKIIGSKPHDEVYDWLDTIDVYVQPSFTEGLCRSIIEAMSRACPVICTDVVGNKELGINSDFLMKPGNINSTVNALLKMQNLDKMRREIIANFEKSKEYQETVLSQKRNDFIRDFMNG